NDKSEGILVRFIKGDIPLSTSFWLVFVPVYVVLVLGAGPIGAWWGGFSERYDLPSMFPLYAMFLIGAVVAAGAGASALRADGAFGNVVLVVVILTAGSYLYSAFKLLIM
ncbi:hypothetical protein MNBD_GAMMA15-828, partial [hydrothermal vent metagenome]